MLCKMKKLKLLVILMSCVLLTGSIFPRTLFAEIVVTEEWVARYDRPEYSGEYAYAMDVDGSGNVYVTGYSDEGTYTDYVTIKYDPSGNQQWARRYDGTGNSIDYGSAIAVDGSGNVYVTGRSHSDTDSDYATVKYDTDGNQQWVARYDGSEYVYASDYGSAIAVDGSGNVYVTGTSRGDYTNDYTTIKYDTDTGQQLWEARYDDSYSGDSAIAMAVDGSGNVYVTGESGRDYATVKYNTNGNQQWVARYSPADSWDRAHDIAVDSLGNVYVTGWSGGPEGTGTYRDYATVKYDGTNGNELWVARYNGPGNEEDSAFAIAMDGSDNVYVTGRSVGSGTDFDYATIKYAPNGDELWVKRYDGPANLQDWAEAIAVDSSGNVYVTGYSGGNCATIKYDGADGTQLWLATYNNGLAHAIAVDSSGNFYVTGYSYSGDDNYTDYTTIKYDTAGTELWAARYPGIFSYYAVPPRLGVDATSEMVVYTSRVYDSGYYDPGNVMCQRLNADGTTNGDVIQVSDETTDDKHNDVGGSRIVYTARESTSSPDGKIMLYDLATGTTTELMAEADKVWEARIEGDIVVWVQGQSGNTRVNYFDLRWPSGSTPLTISGSNPPCGQVDIGSRYVVWSQAVDGQGYIAGYDIYGDNFVSVSADPDVDERNPATFGEYIVWQASHSDGSMTIEIADMSVNPMDRYTAVDNGSLVFRPSIYGNLVAYEARRSSTSNMDIYLYRISDMADFTLTDRPDDQFLNNISGDKVAYVDGSGDGLDIRVSTFKFVSGQPCDGLGGDADGDGVCQDVDNCPGVANPEQGDMDADGYGDVCDNCPRTGNLGQKNTDRDSLGDACDDCPDDYGPDPDRDMTCTSVDNCPDVANQSQNDIDGDGMGDACDDCPLGDDTDDDGVCDDVDNCLLNFNPDQADSDGDGVGDICDDEPPGPCVDPPSGLVGWWPGDGDADDIWSDNHGTLMNGATFASGMVGQAFSLDGVDDYVQIPYDASFNLSNFTLQAWVKFSQSVGVACIISRPSPDAGPYSFFALRITLGKIGGGVQGEGQSYSSSVSTTGSTFNDGEWHLCTFVRDVVLNKISIYVDGFSNWSLPDSSPGDMASNPKGITIGSYDGSKWFFGGLIDEVAIWNRALTADEILAMFMCKQPDIDVSPAEYDFGEVELGTSSTVIVTISNVGTGDLTVDSIAFEGGSSGDFAITTVPLLPEVVLPGGILGDVVITYTASAAGLASAVLNIGSNDPDEPLVVVSLSGAGVVVEPPPSEQIQAILDFFDASVEDGTLVGDGPGNSAENRLNALGDMIETVGDLIEDGLLEDACERLQDAYKKTDGVLRPPDFVTGEAASVLAILIQELMTNIGCG